MNKELSKLITQLEACFEGEPWYGISVMEKLNSIDFNIVNEIPVATTNSIARTVKHMTNWRLFTIEKLRENGDYDIRLNSPEDWPEVTIRSEEEWKELLEGLKTTQQQLIELLDSKEDSFLGQSVPGKNYTYQFSNSLS